MFRLRVQIVFLLGLVGLITSCQTPKPIVLTASPRGGVIDISVGTLDMVNEHRPHAVSPYIDHLYQPSLARLLQKWGEDTLRPVESDGNLLMTVTKADLQEIDIASNDDLKSLFTNEQRKLVIADLSASFSFTHPENLQTASLVVASSYQTTIADYTTPAEAERIRIHVMTEAISRFDAEFRQQILSIEQPNGWPLAP
ncbi:MAG: hypothetical protein ISP46_00110 [Alphaproteobacteria bacterium]|nr:hypothetical protein [Alphaproteobacteria bacterium]